MTDFLNDAYAAIDEQHRDESAHTRRQLVGGAAAALGTLGLLGWVDEADAKLPTAKGLKAPNTPQNIVDIAATAEVLATIVNTIGFERVTMDTTTFRNVRAAAAEEKLHYELLTSATVGAKPLTKRIWVPDAVFASTENFLSTLVVGDQVFINAYLLAGTVFSRAGGTSGARLARYCAEIMGAEAVHRALALQSLGRLGNDRAFMKFGQREAVAGLATTGQGGFYDITKAVTILEAAGFGFGKPGATPGAFYDYEAVAPRAPDPRVIGVNTTTPS